MRTVFFVKASGAHAANLVARVSDDEASAAIASGAAVPNNDGVFGAVAPIAVVAAAPAPAPVVAPVPAPAPTPKI